MLTTLAAATTMAPLARAGQVGSALLLHDIFREAGNTLLSAHTISPVRPAGAVWAYQDGNLAGGAEAEDGSCIAGADSLQATSFATTTKSQWWQADTLSAPSRITFDLTVASGMQTGVLWRADGGSWIGNTLNGWCMVWFYNGVGSRTWFLGKIVAGATGLAEGSSTTNAGDGTHAIDIVELGAGGFKIYIDTTLIFDYTVAADKGDYAANTRLGPHIYALGTSPVIANLKAYS